MRAALAQMEARLPPGRFAAIHRSTIVRVTQIREIQPWSKGEYVVILHDGAKLTSSRGYRHVIAALMRGI